MSKRTCIVILNHLFLLTSISINSFSSDLETLKYKEKITLSQEKEIIAYVTEFAVLEDECYILNDIKDNKIMLFERNGELIKSWKTVGEGPGEYQGLWGNDYNEPFLAIHDLRTNKIILYQRTGKTQFKWIRDIFYPKSHTKNFKLIQDRIILDGLVSHKNKRYFLLTTDLKGNKDEYYLPAAVRYGKSPLSDYTKPYTEFRSTWGLEWSYLDYYNGYIYSGWVGMLNILKINLKTKKWESFGHESKNYTQPKVLKNTMNNWRKKKQWTSENESKFSWVVGVFADKDLVGVMYLVFNKKKSYYEPILQFFNGEGEFINEMLLEGARDIYKKLPHYYSRDFGCLYVLNMTILDSNDIKFEILKYPIQP